MQLQVSTPQVNRYNKFKVIRSKQMRQNLDSSEEIYEEENYYGSEQGSRYSDEFRSNKATKKIKKQMSKGSKQHRMHTQSGMLKKQFYEIINKNYLGEDIDRFDDDESYRYLDESPESLNTEEFFEGYQFILQKKGIKEQITMEMLQEDSVEKMEEEEMSNKKQQKKKKSHTRRFIRGRLKWRNIVSLGKIIQKLKDGSTATSHLSICLMAPLIMDSKENLVQLSKKALTKKLNGLSKQSFDSNLESRRIQRKVMEMYQWQIAQAQQKIIPQKLVKSRIIKRPRKYNRKESIKRRAFINKLAKRSLSQFQERFKAELEEDKTLKKTVDSIFGKLKENRKRRLYDGTNIIDVMKPYIQQRIGDKSEQKQEKEVNSIQEQIQQKMLSTFHTLHRIVLFKIKNATIFLRHQIIKGRRRYHEIVGSESRPPIIVELPKHSEIITKNNDRQLQIKCCNIQNIYDHTFLLGLLGYSGQVILSPQQFKKQLENMLSESIQTQVKELYESFSNTVTNTNIRILNLEDLLQYSKELTQKYKRYEKQINQMSLKDFDFYLKSTHLLYSKNNSLVEQSSVKQFIETFIIQHDLKPQNPQNSYDDIRQIRFQMNIVDSFLSLKQTPKSHQAQQKLSLIKKPKKPKNKKGPGLLGMLEKIKKLSQRKFEEDNNDEREGNL